MYSRKTFFLVGIILLLAVAGCATYKRGKIDVLSSPDDYACRCTAQGVSVAADPYDSTEKAKQGFYVDVTKESFYPVQLIVWNDTSERILVLREESQLIDASNNIYRPVRSTVMADASEHNKMAYALLGFGIFSYMSAEEANRKMASDWREKELPDQLIIPAGRKMNGFLYFQLPEGQTTKGCKLRLEAEKIETREKIPLELLL